jgi:hypothetical protein
MPRSHTFVPSSYIQQAPPQIQLPRESASFSSSFQSQSDVRAAQTSSQDSAASTVLMQQKNEAILQLAEANEIIATLKGAVRKLESEKQDCQDEAAAAKRKVSYWESSYRFGHNKVIFSLKIKSRI